MDPPFSSSVGYRTNFAVTVYSLLPPSRSVHQSGETSKSASFHPMVSSLKHARISPGHAGGLSRRTFLYRVFSSITIPPLGNGQCCLCQDVKPPTTEESIWITQNRVFHNIIIPYFLNFFKLCKLVISWSMWWYCWSYRILWSLWWRWHRWSIRWSLRSSPFS